MCMVDLSKRVINGIFEMIQMRRILCEKPKYTLNTTFAIELLLPKLCQLPIPKYIFSPNILVLFSHRHKWQPLFFEDTKLLVKLHAFPSSVMHQS